MFIATFIFFNEQSLYIFVIIIIIIIIIIIVLLGLSLLLSLLLLVAIAVKVLAAVLSLLLSVVVALIKYQYYLLYQPPFLGFSSVSSCFTSIYPTTVFLRDHNGNQATQIFSVILVIAPYRDVFYHNFQF